MFLYTNNEQAEKEIRQTNPLTISSKIHRDKPNLYANMNKKKPNEGGKRSLQ
jgi:hypothetical protein